MQNTEFKNSIFLCTYTSFNKSYCDEQFFKRFNELGIKNSCIVDNTNNETYYEKLLKRYTKDLCFHINVSTEPKRSVFQRKVYESVNKCREEFLKTNCKYFLIIESDVIPPIDLIDHFEKDIEFLNQAESFSEKSWGILGALYYNGFHNYDLKGLQKTNHVLSGCSLYKRELIEKYPFRYDENNLSPFPDAWICFDSGNEYSLINDHNIICDHLEVSPGNRQI